MLYVVTGAQGFLGRHVVARLAGEGHAILAVDRRPSIETPIDGVQYHVSDLSDPMTLIPPECEPVGEFMLIHLAWDLRSRETSYRVQSEQVSLLAGLLDAWTGRGLKYVISPGSAQEYGGCGGAIDEDAVPIEPLSPYGWAKRAAYEMTASWARRSEIGLLWLRPFIVYGPGQAGSMLIPYAVRQAQAKAPAQFSDCLQKRDFVFVDDVVEAFALGVRKQLPGVNVCNLGCGEAIRARDIIEEIGRELGNIEKFEFGRRPRRTNEPDIQIANFERARAVLGWTPKVYWREGIKRTCAG
ncbi:MAG TPA: NAD(P)-dependent oxidoreductase [Kiritimatiellia bacterium]|nr:NAD(P)-dependent oxidoreductase [Kiritimatiellia bacterium]